MTLQIERLTASAILPSYAHPGDAGMDLCADETRTLLPGERAAVSTGLRIALPAGTEGQVLLVNLGHEPFEITPGMRIAQLVIAPVLRVAIAEAAVSDCTARGTGGFGSTGL